MLNLVYLIIGMLFLCDYAHCLKSNNTPKALRHKFVYTDSSFGSSNGWKSKKSRFVNGVESNQGKYTVSKNNNLLNNITASSSIAMQDYNKDVAVINNTIFNNSQAIQLILLANNNPTIPNKDSNSDSIALYSAKLSAQSTTSVLSSAISNANTSNTALTAAKNDADIADSNLEAAEVKANDAIAAYNNGDSSKLSDALSDLKTAKTNAENANTALANATNNANTANTSLITAKTNAQAAQTNLQTAITNSSNNPVSDSSTQVANESSANSQLTSTTTAITSSTISQATLANTITSASNAQKSITDELVDTQSIIDSLNNDIANPHPSPSSDLVLIGSSLSKSSNSATTIGSLKTQVDNGGAAKLAVSITNSETFTGTLSSSDVKNIISGSSSTVAVGGWNPSTWNPTHNTTPTGSVSALAADGQPSIGMGQVNTTNYIVIGSVIGNDISKKTVESNLASLNNNQVTFSKELLGNLGIEVDSSTGNITSVNLGAYQTLTNQSGSGWVSSTNNSLVGKNIYEFAIQSGKFQNLLTLRPIGDISTGEASLMTEYTGTQEQVDNAANAQLLVTSDYLKNMWVRYFKYAFVASGHGVDDVNSILGKKVTIESMLNDVYSTGKTSFATTINPAGLVAFGYIKGETAASNYAMALLKAYKNPDVTQYFSASGTYSSVTSCVSSSQNCIAIKYDSAKQEFSQNHDTYNYGASNPTPEMYMAMYGAANSSITVSDIGGNQNTWIDESGGCHGASSWSAPAGGCSSKYTAITTSSTTTSYDSTQSQALTGSGSSTLYFKPNTTATTKAGKTLDLSAVSSDLVAVLDSNTSTVKLGLGDNSIYVEQYLSSNSPIKYSNDVSYDFYLNANQEDKSSLLFNGSSSNLRSLSQIHLNSTTTNITLKSMLNYYNASDKSADKAYLISPYQYGSVLTVSDNGKTYDFEYNTNGDYQYTAKQQSDTTLLSFIVSSLSGSNLQTLTDVHLVEISETTGNDTVNIDNKSSYVTISGNGGNDTIDMTGSSGSSKDQVIRITDFNSGDSIKLSGVSTITQLDTGLGTYNQLTGSTTHDYVITAKDGSFEDRIYVTSDHALSITNDIIS